MTADEQALLNAVIAAPDDDLPRLVYADWLEEHGRAERAELIRVQCSLARPQADYRETDERKRWAQRERWLLQRYSVPWRKELPQVPAVEWGRFERGMVESVFASVWQKYEYRYIEFRWDELDALHQHAPLQTLGVNLLSQPIPAHLLRWPGIGRFRSLRFVGTWLNEGDVQRTFIETLIDHDWTRGPAVLDLRKCGLTEGAMNLLIDIPRDRYFPIIDMRRVAPRWTIAEQLRARFGERVLL
jgi:uncharacterized protein (TIGR02996 family)